MATPTTISQTLPAPILEGALTAFTKKLEPLIGQQIQTSAYAPKIAAESQLQQQARTSAGGLESLLGPQAYQQFMSPYQQEVIDTTLAEMDRQAAIQRQGIGQSAIQAGAFGGGREGVQMAEYDVNTLARRAQNSSSIITTRIFTSSTTSSTTISSTTRFRCLSNSTRSSRSSSTTSCIRRSTSCSKRSSIRTIYKIRFSGTTTCTNSTRCISNSNSWLSTTTSSS
jgi:hypothetical protein